jgi:hypothetical protein
VVERDDPWLKPARIRERVMARMGEGDISNAKGVVLAQHGKRVSELVSPEKERRGVIGIAVFKLLRVHVPFHSKETSNLTRSDGRLNVSGTERQLESLLIGMLKEGARRT